MIRQTFSFADGCIVLGEGHFPFKRPEPPRFLVIDEQNRVHGSRTLMDAVERSGEIEGRISLYGKRLRASMVQLPVARGHRKLFGIRLDVQEWKFLRVEKVEVGDREVLLPGGWDPPQKEKLRETLEYFAKSLQAKSLEYFASPGSVIDGYPNSRAAMNAARYRGFAVRHRINGETAAAIADENLSNKYLGDM